MAGCPVFNIINQDRKASGTKKATDSSAGDNKLSQDFFDDAFLDTIRRTRRRLQNVNCTDVLLDYFAKGIGSVSGNRFGGGAKELRKGFNSAINNVNIQKGMSALATGLDKLQISGDKLASDFLCTTVQQAFRETVYWIETVLKAALVILKKIDKLKAQVEKALMDFTDEVRNCIVEVIVDTKIALNKAIQKVTDFDIIADLIVDCPCVEDIFKNLFPFCKDVESPQEIADCIESRFKDVIGAGDLLKGVNNAIDSVISDYINKGFNKFQDHMKDILEMIISPLRSLVKAYCGLLNEKIPVNALIIPFKTIKADCLFLYTEEETKFGTVYKMSIIDFIETLKLWANCMESLCSTFSDEVKLKIKDYNQQLRLNAKFWIDPNMIDIYYACIQFNTRANLPRPTMIREIYSRFASKMYSKVFGELMDLHKIIGKVDTSKTNEEKIEEKYAELGPVADATVFAEGPDQEEVPISQGDLLFKSGVENDIIRIIKNIGLAISQQDYFRRLSELVDWEYRYKKNQQHVEAIEEVMFAFRSGKDTAAPDSLLSGRVTSDVEITSTVLPTYILVNDYSEINNVSKPQQNEGETTLNLYKRWFELATA